MKLNVEQWANMDEPATQQYEAPKNEPIKKSTHDKAMQTLLEKYCPVGAHHPDLTSFVGACKSIGVIQEDCLAFLLHNTDRISPESSYYNNDDQLEVMVTDLYSRYSADFGKYKSEDQTKGGTKQSESKEGPPIDYDEILRTSAIDINEELSQPPTTLSLHQGSVTITIGTLGNFAMIIGKAKSRKTFFVSIIIAAWLRLGLILSKVSGYLPDNRRTVLHFDTEQGKYHVQRTVKRIMKLTGSKGSEYYRAHGLRAYPPAIRLAAIEHAIYRDSTIGAVIIDGIRDLASLGINNEEEATLLTTKLLKWTEERQIHIIVVLHQNKNDANARGHLGTELVNKAETVLSVTKDEKNRDLSVVEAEYCRDKEPEPFGFGIDEEGLPYITESWEIKADKNKKSTKLSPLDIPLETHQVILNQVFANEEKMRHSQLSDRIKLAAQPLLGKQPTDEFARLCILLYLDEKMLEQEGVPKTRTCKYSLKKPV